MIYTVTFNPSLDYILRLDSLEKGEINRVTYEHILPGGKGLNVSMVLKNLGHASRALGFVAGFTGEAVKKQFESFGCEADFVHLAEGFSRINVKIKAKEETEINGQGPQITEAAQEELFRKLEKLRAGDTLVLAGSIPNTLLLKVLKYGPWLIKPNNRELGEMFDTELKTEEELIVHAKKLQEMGAKNVLISMAGEGALFLTESGESFKSPAPKGTLVNSVGAGDSMVAGFLAGYEESGGSWRDAFFMGVATGSASAFSENLARRPEVEALLKTIG